MEMKFENNYVTFNQKQYIEIVKCDYYKSVHIPIQSLVDQSINSKDCNENIFRKLLGSLQYLQMNLGPILPLQYRTYHNFLRNRQ